MGYVVRRKSGTWYAVLRDRCAKSKVWVRLPDSTKTMRDAKREMSCLQDALDRGRLALPKKQDDSGSGWLDVAGELLDEVQGKAMPAWHSACREFVARFGDFVGDCLARDMTPEHCRTYIRRRETEKANRSTLRKEIGFLKRVFRRAQENGLLTSNPWDGIKRPSEPQHAPRFLSQEEVNALFEAAPDERRFRYLFLVCTGARRGEAHRATWGDVDFEKRQIHIPNSSKGRVPRYPFRTVPVSNYLMSELEERRGAPKERIFPSVHNWRRDLLLDAKRAGLGHVRIHDLRHTFASLLAQSGKVTLQEIRDLMGHKSITTTEIYAHLLPDQHKQASAVLDQVLGCYRGDRSRTADVVDVGQTLKNQWRAWQDSNLRPLAPEANALSS